MEHFMDIGRLYLKKEISIYLNYFLFLCTAAFISFNFKCLILQSRFFTDQNGPKVASNENNNDFFKCKSECHNR